MLVAQEIRHWLTLCANLKAVKTQEMSARKQIANDLLGGKAGTTSTEVEEIEVKAYIGEKLSITRDELTPLIPHLLDEEKAAITWKPSINKTLYDKLPKNSILRRCTTLKLASPKVSATDHKVK